MQSGAGIAKILCSKMEEKNLSLRKYLHIIGNINIFSCVLSMLNYFNFPFFN